MKIRLQNFQGHTDSSIETVPGITALTGTTNAGKTSFLRALLHLHQNSLRGTAYIKNGTDKCTITVDNVQRIKAKSTNQYIVDGNMTEALRTGVPHEVMEALKLSNDFLQTQHNSIFLIDKPAGQIAQKLSELIDLDVAHKSIKLVDTERRAAFSEINTSNSLISKAQDRIQELSLVQEASEKLAAIERKAAVVNELNATLVSLQVTLKTAVERKLALDSLPDIGQLRDLPEILNSAKDINKELTAIQGIVNAIDVVVKRKSDIEKLPDIDQLITCPAILAVAGNVKREKEEISKIQGKIDIAKKCLNRKLSIPDELYKSIDVIYVTISDRSNITKHIAIAKDAFKLRGNLNIKLKAKEAAYTKLFGDRCPLCGEGCLNQNH